MNIPETGGLPNDMLHVFQRNYHDKRRRGQRDDTSLLLMGAMMTFIGVKMSLDAWNRMHGGRGR